MFYYECMEENIFNKVCLNIAKNRIAKNLSAYELSLRLGKDASYVNKLESGKINISLKSLIHLSDVLEIDVKDLFI